MPGRLLRPEYRGVLLCVLTVALAFAIVGALWLRTNTLNSRDRSICAKVDRVVLAIEALAEPQTEPPSPGEYGYSYWASHPAERQRRGLPEDAIQKFVADAECDPDSIQP